MHIVSKEKSIRLSRRSFIAGAAATVVASTAYARTPRIKSANEKLNIACVGVGGMGSSDVMGIAATGENIVALCDVDSRRGGALFRHFSDAKNFADYRVMFDKVKNIDAVTVSTPDHMHAPITRAALELGLHVRVQKPMTATVGEARSLTALARSNNLIGAMGNQGHSGSGVRQLCEMLWDNAIGDVREVHIWTNRPEWPQGITAPLPEEEIRKGLDWNLWLGVAPYRPYNKGYCPFKWRGWWDYGCGALGDMGCHIMDPANWALQLGAPVSIECVKQGGCTDQSPPLYSVIKYEFPEREFKDPYPSVKWYGKKLPPVTVYWYDGKLPDGTPNLPDFPEGAQGLRDNGSLFIGTDGMATTGTYGGGSRLLPKERMNDYTMPDEVIPRVQDGNPYLEWVTACKGGAMIGANFDYAGPFTETVLLGNVATRVGEGINIQWDADALHSPNCEEANRYIERKYRQGW